MRLSRGPSFVDRREPAAWSSTQTHPARNYKLRTSEDPRKSLTHTHTLKRNAMVVND